MALSGALLADFSSFQAATDGAIVKLKSFESGSEKVATSLSRMTDSFSGRKLIQEATLMAEVFDRAGKGAGLTAGELERMGTVGAAAIEKLRVTGQPIPAQLQAMADGARKTRLELDSLATGLSASGKEASASGKLIAGLTAAGAPGMKALADETKAFGTAALTAKAPVTDLHGSLQAFDGVLAAMGIHIGPEIRGLGDLAAASGKTASQLGLLATGGLALGAGIGGWKLGRLAAEFLGTDVAIGNATAKLLGWGDAVAEASGAKQDTINKAIADGADAMISYADAIVFNTQTFKQALADGALPSYRLHLEAIGVAAAALSDEEQDLIKDALALGESTTQIAKAMNLSEGAVGQYAASLKTLATDQAAAEAEAQKFKAAVTELTTAGQSYQTTLNAIDGETVNAIQYYLQAGISQAALATAYGLTAEQIRGVVGALQDEKVAIDAAAAADTARAAARAAADAKIQEERAAIQPNDKYGTKIKYGQSPSDAFAGLAPIAGGGMTDASGKAITSITQDIAPAAPPSYVGPGKSSGGGTITVTINAAGLTPAELTRQIEAELVKSAKLKRLVSGT
jgi:hypothetical protein